MWGFKNGDKILTKDGRQGFVIRNFVGTTCFMVEEIEDNKRLGKYFVVDREEIVEVI